MAENTKMGEETSESDGLGTTGKTLAGAVAIVIAAAGTFGTATGGLAFLLRNDALKLISALFLAALAAVFATWAILWIAKKERTLENPKWIRILWLTASAAVLAVALLLVLITQASLARNSSRPVIKAEFSNSTNGALLKVSVDADTLAVDDQLVIGVIGANGSTFYWGSTGGDRNGHASQGTTIPVPLGVTDALSVSASVVTKDELGEANAADVFVTCDGTLHNANSGNSIRRLAHPACVVIKGIPTSLPKPSSGGGA
jgi:hypothetical protein